MSDLKRRTKKFALDVIRYCRKSPRGEEFSVIKHQLVKASTSTAANYRASQRAKSKADFISKMGTVEEESDDRCSGWSAFKNPPPANIVN